MHKKFLRKKLFFRFQENMGSMLFSPADDGAGGGGGSEDPPRRQDPAVISSRYGGDVTRMAIQIDDTERDNARYRQKNRDLTSENERLKGLVPKEGTVVLTAEEAKDLEEYKKLGKPAELQTLKTNNETYEVERAKNKRQDMLREVSKAVTPGIKYNEKILFDLDSRLTEAVYEKREVEGVPQYFIKYKEGQGEGATLKEEPVHTFFNNKFPEYMSALVSTQDTQSTGVLYPEQLPTDRSAPKIPMSDSYTDSRYGHHFPKK